MKTLIQLLSILHLLSFCPSEYEDLNKFKEEGIASYYSDYYQGRLTASGERFDQMKATAAHKTLPFGSVVEVLNLSNNRSVQVTINDRGPFVNGRIIDLSYLAAERLDMIEKGIVSVRIELVKEELLRQ